MTDDLVEKVAKAMLDVDPGFFEAHELNLMGEARAAIAVVLKEQLRQSDNIPYMEQAAMQFARENGKRYETR